jgi:hypothetical protein
MRGEARTGLLGGLRVALAPGLPLPPSCSPGVEVSGAGVITVAGLITCVRTAYVPPTPMTSRAVSTTAYTSQPPAGR